MRFTILRTYLRRAVEAAVNSLCSVSEILYKGEDEESKHTKCVEKREGKSFKCKVKEYT